MGSDFLYANPSFVEGMARVIDLGGTIERFSYNTSDSAAEADSRALYADWSAVGADLKDSLRKFEPSDK